MYNIRKSSKLVDGIAIIILHDCSLLLLFCVHFRPFKISNSKLGISREQEKAKKANKNLTHPTTPAQHGPVNEDEKTIFCHQNVFLEIPRNMRKTLLSVMKIDGRSTLFTQ